MNRFQERLSEYKNAVDRLEEALKEILGQDGFIDPTYKL